MFEQVLNNGKRIPMACIDQPTFHIFINQWLEIVADSGVDLVAWDQPFTPTHKDKDGNSLWGCSCRV